MDEKLSIHFVCLVFKRYAKNRNGGPLYPLSIDWMRRVDLINQITSLCVTRIPGNHASCCMNIRQFSSHSVEIDALGPIRTLAMERNAATHLPKADNAKRKLKLLLINLSCSLAR